MIQLTHSGNTTPEYWVNPHYIVEVYVRNNATQLGILGQKYATSVKESPQEVLTKIKLFKEKTND